MASVGLGIFKSEFGGDDLSPLLVLAELSLERPATKRWPSADRDVTLLGLFISLPLFL